MLSWWLIPIVIHYTASSSETLNERQRINELIDDLEMLEGVKGLLMFEGNTILATSCPVFIKTMTYGILIDCLIQKESSGNPKAYNEFDPETESIGVLQYKRATFQHFCVERYGLENDIWNEDIQRRCCDLMIDDNYLEHWSTYKLCL